jgi:hypothetical protein
LADAPEVPDSAGAQGASGGAISATGAIVSSSVSDLHPRFHPRVEASQEAARYGWNHDELIVMATA